MADKQALIAEMLEMQTKFQEFERANGVNPKDYFTPEDDHELAGYRQKYNELAMQLVDAEHEEKGSHR